MALDPAMLMKILGISTGAAQAGGGLGSLFAPQKNPADVAQDYLKNIPDAIKPLLEPFINAGKGGLQDYQTQAGQLTGQTGDIYNRLAGGYQESPGYKKALDEAMRASTNAAAAGGMAGTPMHQQQAMETAQGVASKDFNEYMKNQLGLYGLGFGGLGDIMKQGFAGSSDLASMLGNLIGQQAQYGYSGQAGQNQATSGGLGDVIGGLASILPFLLML